MNPQSKQGQETNFPKSGSWSHDQDGLIYDNNGKLIAEAFAYRGKVTDKVIACAGFIVIATNSFYDLLDACEEALRVLNKPAFVEGERVKCIKRLESALAKAGEWK